MTRNRSKRQGIVKFLGDVLDDGKELVDDILDRARDVDDDLRSAARKVIDPDNDDHDDDSDGDSVAASDVRALRESLADLAEKVNQLAALQQQDLQRRAPQEKPAPAST